MAKKYEKKRTKKYLRSARGIKVGDRFRYISNGYQSFEDGQPILISRGAEYDADVIQVTEHLIVMNICVDQSTINRPCIWEPQSFNWAIRKVDVGTTEKLYLYA